MRTSRPWRRAAPRPDDLLDPAVRAALDTLRDSAAARPAPQFRDALRARLLEEAARPTGELVPVRPEPSTAGSVVVLAPPRRAAERHRRLVGVAAGVLALAVAGTGAVVGGHRSLPGQPLYPVKRSVEAAQLLRLKATSTPLALGLGHLHLAETRLAEVHALAAGRASLGLPLAEGRHASVLAAGLPSGQAAGASTSELDRALAAMDEQTEIGSGLVQRAVAQTRQTAPLAVLSAWSGQQGGRLRAVVPLLPAPAQDRAQESLRLLAGLGQQAQALQRADAAATAPTATPTPGTSPSPATDAAPRRSTASSPRPASGSPAGTPGSGGGPAPTPTRPALPRTPHPSFSPPTLPTLPAPTFTPPTFVPPTLPTGGGGPGSGSPSTDPPPSGGASTSPPSGGGGPGGSPSTDPTDSLAPTPSPFPSDLGSPGLG